MECVRLTLGYSTQLYVEAEASMNTYEDQNGAKRVALNLLQRTSHGPHYGSYQLLTSAGNFEALARPLNRDASAETTGAESGTDAAHEPLSGVGQS